MARGVIFTVAASGLCLVLAGQAQGVVDVHSHYLPEAYISHIAAYGKLMDEGFPLPKWSEDAHLAWMDAAGIEKSVLTLPAPQPMFGSKEENAILVRRLNEEAARIRREHPRRFLFCATLPLPDVEAALKEIDYAFDVLGADGVKLATTTRTVIDIDEDWLIGLHQALADTLQQQLPDFIKVTLSIDKNKLSTYLKTDNTLLVNNPEHIHTRDSVSTTIK